MGILVMLVSAAPANARENSPSEYSRTPFAHIFETDPPPALLPALTPGIDWQEATQPPPKKHTGFQALIRTVGADFKAFPRRRSTYVILGIGAAAAALAHPIDDNLNAHVRGSSAVDKLFTPGKYLGNGMLLAGASVGTYVIGRALPKKDGKPHQLAHLGFDLVRANILTQSLTYGMKQAFRRNRPTGECCSFPSGHASGTFAVASVLERHFGYRASWPTFLIAGYVAASRLHDDKHFLSDVLFGSALGIASGWTVVGRHGRDEYAIVPVPTKGGVMIAVVNR